MILWESFNKNEIYIVVALVFAFGTFMFLPRNLCRRTTILFLTWGFTISLLFDFTIGGGLIDFYKVNDSNKYELFDLLTYFIFAFFSYFFVYFYQKFKINKTCFIPYIIVWTLVGLIMEKISTLVEVIEYQNGYSIKFSVIVFLIVQTTTVLYYELVKRSKI